MAEHAALENTSSTTPMLTKEGEDSTVANGKTPTSPTNPISKILLREDTYMGKLGGCHGCNGVKITCAGVKQQGALCWGKYTDIGFAWLLTGSITVLLISMVGTILFCFTNVFDNTIKSNMAIVNNTMAYEMWRKPPVHPLTKVYIFNYTNVNAFMHGLDDKLKVEEVGPYVYKEDLEKINVVFNPDGTVTFKEKRSYKFIPEQSSGRQFDKVVVPNMPYLSAVSMARDSFYVTRMGLNALLNSLDSKPFTNLPVHRFLWGYEDPLVNLVKPLLAFKGETPPTLGLLANRNGTSLETMTIDTGTLDINKIGLIKSVGKLQKMSHWGTEACNAIDASDGSMFSPEAIENKKTVYLFNSELCRRLPLDYKEGVEIWDGIPAYRYGFPDNVFDQPSLNPENQCFCHMDSGSCPPSGLFNATPCAYGAPVFASFPHFYLGDKALINAIDGLKPEKSKHESYLDIQPKLGFVFGAVSRIQLNFQVRKAGGVNDFLPDGIYLPSAWMEVTIAEIPASLRSLVYHGTYSAAAVHMVLSWGCVLLFVLSSLVLIITIRRGMKKRRHHCSMLKKQNLGDVVKIEKTNNLKDDIKN